MTASVGPFDAPAGGVPGEDLALPAPNGAGRAPALGHAGVVGPAVAQRERVTAALETPGAVELAEELGELPGGGELPVAVAVGQPAGQPGPGGGGEVVGRGQQQPADADSGPRLQPRCPRVARCTRRRTSSTMRLVSCAAWKWSTTRVAWPRCMPTA
jgi:hypothetical protein